MIKFLNSALEEYGNNPIVLKKYAFKHYKDIQTTVNNFHTTGIFMKFVKTIDILRFRK